jgi:hypothetical protein
LVFAQQSFGVGADDDGTVGIRWISATDLHDDQADNLATALDEYERDEIRRVKVKVAHTASFSVVEETSAAE